MTRHASFSSRLFRSGRRACRPRGVPDDGVPHPRSDYGADIDVDVIADADRDDNVDADVCVHVDDSEYGNAIGNGNGNGNAGANGSADVDEIANANGNVYANTRRDPNPPTLTHPDSGRPIDRSRRRVGCAAN